MIWIIFGTVLLLLVVGSVYLFRTAHKSPSLVGRGYDGEMRSRMICKSLQGTSGTDEVYEVHTYKNVVGEVGGFMAVSNLDGGVTHYYDKNGSLILALGTRPPDQEEMKKLDSWNESIKAYTVKKVYPCSKVIN